jgi:hypothetical protein
MDLFLCQSLKYKLNFDHERLHKKSLKSCKLRKLEILCNKSGQNLVESGQNRTISGNLYYLVRFEIIRIVLSEMVLSADPLYEEIQNIQFQNSVLKQKQNRNKTKTKLDSVLDCFQPIIHSPLWVEQKKETETKQKAFSSSRSPYNSKIILGHCGILI